MKQIDAAKTWSLSYRLLVSVLANVSSDLEALGLDPKGLFLLAAVDEHPYPAQLAAELCMPKPSVTVGVKRLEARGLVKRQLDPTDLRRHELTLTAAGRKTMTRGLAILSAAYGERLARLTPAQQVELRSLLQKMS